jgi:hypothetical protein
MTSKRLYFIMIAVVCLLVAGFLGGAYGADKLLSRQSQKVLTARSKSASLEQKQTQLTRAKTSITKYKAVGDIAKTIVPQDKDQAQAVREIVNLAAANGVSLGTITFPNSTLGSAAATSGSAGSSSGSKSASGSSSSSSAAKLSQLKAASGINGVYIMQITVQSDTAKPIAYGQFIDFLAAMERNRRTALVSSLNVQPQQDDPSQVSFVLTVDEYIKP